MAPMIQRATESEQRVLREKPRPVMAKADLSNRMIGSDFSDFRSVVGHAVQRAFSLAGLSIKEAAGQIGREPQQISRWISGAERAQLDAIFAVEQLRLPFIQALAEMAGEAVEVRTEITLKRRVG